MHVRIDGDDYRVDHVVEGDSVAEVLSYVQYNKEDLISRVRRAVEAALREKRLTMAESGRFMKRYEEALEGYTYLSLERVGGPAREAPVADATLQTPLTRAAGIEVPLLCGAMYPCSNPELVAAVSEAGGIGIVQPISLTYVHGHDFREGLRLIRRLTVEADRHERAHRAVLEDLPRADGALDRRGARGGRALLRHLARQPALGGRAGLAPRAASSTTT